MNWKFVMRAENAMTIESADNMARIAGYEFLLWNGEVYFLHNKGRTKTEIKLKDLY